MWLKGLFIIYCSLISLQICRVEAWSGHVCSTYRVTYFTERYCARYGWWTGAYDCKVWKTRQSSKISSAQHCCSGWKHNGNNICNIHTNITSVPVNASIIEASKYADNRDKISAEISIVKRQVNICGGYLTAETWTKTLTSPNYPFPYPNNLRCNWTIAASVNYVIVIHITYLDLGENTDCSFDYLSINLGRNPNLETNRICTNKTKDLRFITRSNGGSVTFVTNGSISNRGFSVEYRAVLNCGKHLKAQTSTATLTSPLYPSKYGNNLNCHWIIEGPTNSTIVMQITYIDLEETTDCSLDYIKIYLGGNSIFATDRICRNNMKDINYISRSNEADVIFVTDSSVVRTGFSLQYHAATNCGGRLSAGNTSAILSSPYYPLQYNNNLHCHWTIEGSIGSRIAIQIVFIDIEENFDCSYDYLQIYIGESNIVETSRICRYNATDLNVITRSDKADVIFVTDGSIKKTGFSLTYKSVPRCGGYLTVETATSNLTSPGYRNQYQNNLYCLWTIKGPIHSRIALNITYIDVEKRHDYCPFDFLQIYLGNHYILKTTRICGNNTKGLIFISGSNEADLIFVTDGSVTNTGFYLQYHAVSSCGGQFLAGTDTATLDSPNYGSKYDNYLRCHWSIKAPIGYRIDINITDIDLEVNSDCSYDYLQIYLGNNYILETHRICRRNNESLYFISMSDEVHVIFITDGSVTKRGFSLQYQAAINCGGNLTAQVATAKLTSPYYSSRYDNNLRCHWILESPFSYRIFIHITTTDIEDNRECSSGYLQLYLGTNYTFQTDRICRNNIQDLNFITTSNQAEVIFVTNGTRTKTEFSLQYHAVSYCEGHLTAQKETSTLSSPNYPVQYKNNLYCHWTIDAPISHRIVINITHIKFEENSDCSYDYLEIYLDKNDTAKSHRICRNNTEDLAFITTSNQTDIIFVTTGNLTKSGFLLEYKAVYNCGSHLIAQTTEETLTSPNYPSTYENNLNCHWTIEAPINLKIAMHITHIDLEGDGRCSYDYLQFYLGSNQTSTTDRICSNNTENLNFITTSNRADAIFVTDATKTSTGFSLQYEAVAPCGGHLTAQITTATLTSPHYPSQYENNLYCHWTIEAPMNYKIAIQVTNVDFEANSNCSHDYLQIYLGTNSTFRTDRICINNTKDLNFVTMSHQAEVFFVTDANRAKKGFSLQYQAGTCYCEGGSGHVDCNVDLNQQHLNGFVLVNGNCVETSDDIAKSEAAGPARLDVNILIPSVAGLVVAIIIALGLWFYCRRRTRRDKERREERPCTEMQSMKSVETEDNIYIVPMPSNNTKTSDNLQDDSDIYENLT